MKKMIITFLLGILLIGTFGAAVVSAVASDNAKANYDFGSMQKLCARYMNSGNDEGSFSCHNLDSNEGAEPTNTDFGNTDTGNSEGSFSCH
ncbi:MAG: hypothetical protein WB014_02710 [Methanosarcina sp.]